MGSDGLLRVRVRRSPDRKRDTRRPTDVVAYLELILRWLYPMPDGPMLGSDSAEARALVDVPDDWPSSRPRITIAEPGPAPSG